MRINQRMMLTGALILAGVLALAACGSSKKTETTAAAATAASSAPASSEAETTTAAPKVGLNFDYANLMGDNYDAVVKEFGKPSSEKEADVSRILTYTKPDCTVVLYTDDETANYGRENSVWLIETSAADLFGLTDTPVRADELADMVSDNKKIEKVQGNNIDGYEFGKSTDSVYSFDADGYQIQIVPESDGTISGKSRVVIISLQDVETPESGESTSD